MEYVNLNRDFKKKDGRDVNINFFLNCTNIFCFVFYLKLTLYYCEVCLSVLSLL